MNDLIKRQDAIDAVMKYGKQIPTFAIAVKDALENLPSAQPEQLEKCPIYGGVCLHPSDQCYECPRHAGAERKKGKWIPYSKVYECRYECSSCGYHLIGIHESEANFCPNCGADMGGEQDE